MEAASVILQLVIQICCLDRRACRCNGCAILIGEVAEGEHLAIAALEPLVFGVRHKDEAVMPMMRNRERVLQRLLAEGPKTAAGHLRD
jgi:hypothetical protein